MGVAVAGTVLGASLVVGELRHATVGVHLTEVESAVETARELRHVNVEGELLVQELEHLVLGLAAHEVDTRADVGARDELQSERVAGGRDAVSTLVVGTVEGAVLRASDTVGTERGVPFITGVAVRVSADGVEPAPVGVEDNSRVLGDAASAGRALLGRELGVGLGCLGAGLLAVHHSGEREREESQCAEHGAVREM